MQNIYYAPQGIIFLAPVATPTLFKHIGNAKALAIEFESSHTSHRESHTGMRSGDAGFSSVGAASVTLTLDTLNRDALEIALGARHKVVAAGTVSNELLNFSADGYAVLRHGNVLGLALLSATNNVIPPGQYSLLHGGVVKLHDSSLGVGFVYAHYSYAATTQSSMLANIGQEWVLRYMATNSGNGNRPFECVLNRVMFGAANKIDLISDEFGSYDIKGTLSADFSLANANNPFGAFGRLVQA